MPLNSDKPPFFFDEEFPKPSIQLICVPQRYYMTGMIGGGIVGLMSGFFDPKRIIEPVSPLPPGASSSAHHTVKTMIKSSALGWRVTKRLWVGSLLYAYCVCTFQGEKKNPSIIDCAAAGSVCGTIFGLRGGMIMSMHGGLTFMILGGLAEAWRQYRGV